jgi:predicted Zn-dependent protease
MRSIARAIGFALVAAMMGACATTDVGSIKDSKTGYGTYEDERKLIERANEQEAELRGRGFLSEDPDLEAYVEKITKRLIPSGLPEGLEFRFRVIRVPTINAFAAANGDIYVHAGLLAHLENEAQLAHVLAHEITHTLKRHQLKALRDFQNKTVVAKVAQMAIGVAVGVGAGGDAAGLASLLVSLSHAAAVTGYSRELEQEADRAGLEVIAQAGYAIEEAPKLFSLLNEVEEPGEIEAFFYATHPSNAARAVYTRELIETGAVARNLEGRVAIADYRAAVRKTVLENLRIRVRKHHYAFALKEAETALERYGEDSWLYYYKGEAHRRTAEDPEGAAREEAGRAREGLDQKRVEAFEARAPQQLEYAAAAYQRALELDPALALAHRGLGLAAYQRGDEETARAELQRYLSDSTKILDRRFVEHILEEVGDDSGLP